MKCRAEQLTDHLAQPLASVYLLSGDESLLVDEVAQQIRLAAKRSGIDEIEQHVAGTGFNWVELYDRSANLSLFGSAKLVDINVPTGGLGRDGSVVLLRLLEHKPVTCLLLRFPKLDRSQAQSKWVKQIQKEGVHVELWPLSRAEWPRWLKRRLEQRGFQPDREALALLVERLEGNLLTAQQEIDKLSLLLGSGVLSAQTVQSVVADSSHYDVFSLADASLEGDLARTIKILWSLRDEGVEPTLVLWALVRDWRSVAILAQQIAHGATLEQAMASLHIWPKRQTLFRQALSRVRSVSRLREALARAHDVDRQIKGIELGDAWYALAALVAFLAHPNDHPLPSLMNSSATNSQWMSAGLLSA